MRHFEVLDEDWAVEARVTEVLADLGLPSAALDRRVGELSGGEALLITIAGLRLLGSRATCARSSPNPGAS